MTTEQTKQIELPPLHPDAFKVVVEIIDAGRKVIPLNSQAQRAILFVTEWLESAKEIDPPKVDPPKEA